jgi:hypothetical protein
MRGYARRLLLAALLLRPDPGAAQSLYLPTPPTGPGGEDTIETESGVRCRQSMNSNGAYVDFGVTGTTSSAGSQQNNSFFPQARDGQQATGYARITLPLGPRPQRLDCSRIYEMEIARMKREMELLQMAVQEK